MRARWHRWRTSLWFLPAAMVLAAFALAVGMIEVTGAVPRELLIRYPRLFGADAQSSRSMLSTIAGSMATIAGVTFSITVVAVSQASNQYTSRILRNFMTDRPSQIVLGMLTGTFVYCLVLIRTIRGDADLLFIPGLGVLLAFALAILSIAFLVYFIHHIAESLQAAQILARVRLETVAAIDRLYPAVTRSDASEAAAPPVSDAGEWQRIDAIRTGYLQQVDRAALDEWADRHDSVICLVYRVGEFVVEGTVLFRIRCSRSSPTDEDKRLLINACTIGVSRTIDQDATFGIQQIVDIAEKALSPGINDSTTAVNAIDTLGAILMRLGSRRLEGSTGPPESARLRIPGLSYAEFVSLAVHPVRRSAAGNIGVAVHLLHTLARVIRETPSLERRMVLTHHADLIRETTAPPILTANDEDIIAVARGLVDTAQRESSNGAT